MQGARERFLLFPTCFVVPKGALILVWSSFSRKYWDGAFCRRHTYGLLHRAQKWATISLRKSKNLRSEFEPRTPVGCHQFSSGKELSATDICGTEIDFYLWFLKYGTTAARNQPGPHALSPATLNCKMYGLTGSHSSFWGLRGEHSLKSLEIIAKPQERTQE